MPSTSSNLKWYVYKQATPETKPSVRNETENVCWQLLKTKNKKKNKTSRETKIKSLEFSSVDVRREKTQTEGPNSNRHNHRQRDECTLNRLQHLDLSSCQNTPLFFSKCAGLSPHRHGNTLSCGGTGGFSRRGGIPPHLHTPTLRSGVQFQKNLFIPWSAFFSSSSLLPFSHISSHWRR